MYERSSGSQFLGQEVAKFNVLVTQQASARLTQYLPVVQIRLLWVVGTPKGRSQ